PALELIDGADLDARRQPFPQQPHLGVEGGDERAGRSVRGQRGMRSSSAPASMASTASNAASARGISPSARAKGHVLSGETSKDAVFAAGRGSPFLLNPHS